MESTRPPHKTDFYTHEIIFYADCYSPRRIDHFFINGLEYLGKSFLIDTPHQTLKRKRLVRLEKESGLVST